MRSTLHRSLPPELRIMPMVCRMVDLIGLREPRRNFYRFVLAFGWGFFVILFPKAVLGMGSTKISFIVKGLGEFLFLGNLFATFLILVLNVKPFERVIQQLSEMILDVTTEEDQPKECYNLIREQTSKMNKFAAFYFSCCCFGPCIFCIPAVTTSYMRYFGTHNGSEPVQFEPPMEEDFYGLELRTDFVKYNFFLVIALPAFYICAYFSMIKTTSLLILIEYSALMYRVVAIRIRKLAKYDTSVDFKTNLTVLNDTKVKEVVEIVQLHNKALRITDLVEQIVNIPIMMQYLCCLTFWCLVMFYVSISIDSNLISVMVPFFLSLIETYGYSSLGTELTESAKAVGAAVYELNWYNEPVQLQRYYRLILQRSQQETGVTAAKFCMAGKEKFGKLVNKSYSYYLVLKDVFNKFY